jgi:hypothetical protein
MTIRDEETNTIVTRVQDTGVLCVRAVTVDEDLDRTDISVNTRDVETDVIGTYCLASDFADVRVQCRYWRTMCAPCKRDRT